MVCVFVGRITGQDVGYAGEQGGERRAAWELEHGKGADTDR
jgi:hypothetical protein